MSLKHITPKGFKKEKHFEKNAQDYSEDESRNNGMNNLTNEELSNFINQIHNAPELISFFNNFNNKYYAWKEKNSVQNNTEEVFLSFIKTELIQNLRYEDLSPSLKEELRGRLDVYSLSQKDYSFLASQIANYIDLRKLGLTNFFEKTGSNFTEDKEKISVNSLTSNDMRLLASRLKRYLNYDNTLIHTNNTLSKRLLKIIIWGILGSYILVTCLIFLFIFELYIK